MARNELTPWRWGGLRRSPEKEEGRGLESFRRDIDELHRSLDRLFDEVWSGGSTSSLLPEFWSRGDVTADLDVSEDDRAFYVSVELPGLDEDDVSVSLSDRLLTISGEKNAEKENKDKNTYRRERAYGSFRRTVEIPGDVDIDNIDAKFKKGVLSIELPKTKESQQKVRRIPVKAA